MAPDNVPPYIAAQLKYLLTQFPHPIEMDRMGSGSNITPRLIDRFLLVIPYCLDVIRWEVIFDAENPTLAPDVVFGPEDEGFHPFHMEQVEGTQEFKLSKNVLRDWSYKDPSRLLLLIKFLRDQYIVYQRKRVSEIDDHRLKFEISTINSLEGLEMYLYSVAEKPKEVKLSIPLMGTKLNDAFHVFSWNNPQKIYLLVRYPIAYYRSAPCAPDMKCTSTPEMMVVFAINDVKLPPWFNEMCMAEYIPQVEELLERKILEAVSLVETRRRFIGALASRLGWAVEADSVFCRKATFLVCSGAFVFLVHVLISTHFPRHQPALMLQSSQHFSSQGAPIKSQLLNEYPWSSRWQLLEMAERIFDFVTDEAVNFKRHCNDVPPQL